MIDPAIPLTVKVAAFNVVAFIASLKLALIDVPMATFVAPFAGLVEETAGGVAPAGFGAVVKLHVALVARALPAVSRAPVVIMAV